MRFIESSFFSSLSRKISLVFYRVSLEGAGLPSAEEDCMNWACIRICWV
jgi:hypothetical protein